MWKLLTLSRVAGAIALAAVGLSAAAAQDNSPIKKDAASNNKVVGAGSGSGGGSPNTIVDPSNGGVAGTGLGKMPAKGSDPGTGNSVKGPAGQGIDGAAKTE